ncbi:MAG: phosphotransferase family protein [Anaerolineales bacterium]|nr:phosphotransferase family protein [Anaerolineales bacterium]
MPIMFKEAIEELPAWEGKVKKISPLSGGLTNTNFLVEVDDTQYFVRLPGESTDLLAIDRDNEYFNTKAAAETGVGPKVIDYLPKYQIMVLEFIQGETMSIEKLQAPGMPVRIAESLKQLHSGPRFMTDFNMFRLTEYYLDICDQRGIKIPDGYPERLPTIERIEKAMALQPIEAVPCNNDLLAENYIDDGEVLRLIDYEYSGNNDPTFELGNTCQELEYSESQIQQLCEAYFGKLTQAMLARMKLNMIMSDVGWGLWAAIQEDISTIDFDFWGWAIERWGRAVEKMDAPEFEDWLEAVAGKE